MDLNQLTPYAETQTQLSSLEAMIEHGTSRKAAKALGISKSSINSTIKRIKKNAAKRGFSPEHGMTAPLPDPLFIKRVSINTDGNDVVRQKWIIGEPRKEEAFQRVLDVLEDKVKGLPTIPKITQPKKNNSDLCTVYTITDFHLGSYTWADETGDDWDTEIAERVLINAFNDLMAGSPNSEVAIFNQLGDMLHWDGLDAVTPTAGHVLEADTRFPKLVELALDVCVQAVGMLLTKHKKVRVIMAEGNHDMAGSVWMQKAIKKIFSKNPRVEVDDSAFPFYAYLHGEIMLGFHHGHKVKNKSLPALFASEPRYRKMWGNAKYTYIHTGHFHHAEQDMAEGGGAIVERHPTLAGRDAYAARGGWVSHRAARAITYHKQHGEDVRVSKVPRID